jgi:hypothetical protein
MIRRAPRLGRIRDNDRGGERSGLRFRHSTMQASKARASASARGKPSNSAMPVRSSKKAGQSSADRPSAARRSMLTISAL